MEILIKLFKKIFKQCQNRVLKILRSDHNLAPILINSYPLPVAKFGGNCLRLSSISTHKNVANAYISYRLDTWSQDLSKDFTLGNCLFGAMKLTKMLILINMDMVVMVLDLINRQ